MSTITPRNLLQYYSQKITVRAVAMILPGVLFAGVASAQQDEAISIKLGETDLTPSVRFDYTQNSNAFLQDEDPVEVTGFLIKPQVEWVADRRLLTLTGGYAGEYGVFSEDILNYNDHEFSAQVKADFTSRKRARGNANLSFGHQALGENFTRGANADSNLDKVEFIDFGLEGAYLYGAERAKGNIEFGLKLNSRSYQNNAELTSGSGYTSIVPYGIFSLRVSADTRALVELRLGAVNFGAKARDRNDISLLGGFTFAPTGKFGGGLKLGTGLSKFSVSNRADKSSFLAEADIFYEPTSFSRFDLTLLRALENDAGNVLFADEVLSVATEARLRWRHTWSSRVFHVANLNYKTQERGCPNSDVAFTGAGLEMNFVIRRWLQAGASFRATSRALTLCETAEDTSNDTDYDRQVIGVHFRATL